jgi:hypothetical protein
MGIDRVFAQRLVARLGFTLSLFFLLAIIAFAFP